MLKFWISLVLGIICILAWLGGREEAAAAANWPSVPGTIKEMSITHSASRDGGTDDHASVKYSYAVNGKPYEGDRIKVEASTDVSDAQRYPKDTQVTVYYNPARPQDAILERGGSGMIMWGVFGFGCLGFAVYAFLSRAKRT